MNIDGIIAQHESETDRAAAYRIIRDWEGGGTMAHNLVRFGLQMLRAGNAQLADEVHKYLQEELGY